MTIRDKVEKWINDAPSEITIVKNVEISENKYPLWELGRRTPIFLIDGFIGTINFTCKKWDEREV